MKYYKKIIGEKCYLSPLCVDDAAKYTEWLNDLEVAINITIASRSITAEGERKLLENLSADHNYAIVDARTDTLIGNCGFMNLNQLHRTADLGIFIGDKEYWGKGYGEEAIGLLTDYGFSILNLRNIMLSVYSFNKRAIRCYEKCGFHLIGRRREALEIGGAVYDILFMDLLASEAKPSSILAQTIRTER